MERLPFKVCTAAFITLFASSLLMADVVVDADFDDDQNDLGGYWYYYDDNYLLGFYDRPQIAPASRPSVIDVPYTEYERNGYNRNDPEDNYVIKRYDFQTTEHMEKKCATMPFTFGEPWEATYCSDGNACAIPYVGIGTMLAEEGKSINLTDITGFRFFIKSRIHELSEVRFNVHTLDIDQYATRPPAELQGDEHGYYGYTFAVLPGEWQEITVSVEQLDLPGTWAADYDFDITKCTKLAWEIRGDGVMTRDTLDIAGVSMISYTPRISMWLPEASGYPDGSHFFSDFESLPYDLSKLNTSWYIFDDGEYSGTSEVSDFYAERDSVSGLWNIRFIDSTGGPDFTGRSASLEYTIGGQMVIDGYTLNGFTGIGCDLYDSARVKYWDASVAGANTVFFEYFTNDGAKSVVLELLDVNDVGDGDNPDRRYTRGTGNVYYRKFPPTNGTWRKVLIPFDSLLTHGDWEGYNHSPLDKTKLARIRWKVSGAEGMSGVFAVDNVCFPDAVFGTDVKTHGIVKNAPAGFKAVYANGAIRVTLGSTVKGTAGNVSLIDARGAVVATGTIDASAGAAFISTEHLSPGMYIVSLCRVDTDDTAIPSYTSVTLIR